MPSRAAVPPRPGTGPPRQRSRADPGRPALSSRELEVLRLLTDGASNPDIGKTLPHRRTAEHHVEHILTKLDVTSRTAAVAHALTHELLSRTERVPRSTDQATRTPGSVGPSAPAPPGPAELRVMGERPDKPERGRGLG